METPKKKNFRQISRIDNFIHRGPAPTTEEINTGSLQRIADAVEFLSKDRDEMKKSIEWYKGNFTRNNRTIYDLKKQLSAQMGAKTKAKNERDKLKKENIILSEQINSIRFAPISSLLDSAEKDDFNSFKGYKKAVTDIQNLLREIFND